MKEKVLRRSVEHFWRMWKSDMEATDLLAYAESLANDVEWFLDSNNGGESK